LVELAAENEKQTSEIKKLSHIESEKKRLMKENEALKKG
jgi:cell shape-determining protein MreC